MHAPARLGWTEGDEDQQGPNEGLYETIMSGIIGRLVFRFQAWRRWRAMWRRPFSKDGLAVSPLSGTRKRVRKCKHYVSRRNIVSRFGVITKIVCSYVHKLPRSNPLR
jgi:hypothetical protein